MPVTFEVLEQGYVMHWAINDPWTIPELMAHYKESDAVLNNTQHTVHSLVDARHAHKIPDHVLKARAAGSWDHPRSGQIVVLGASPVMKALMEVMFRLMRFDRVRFFDRETEAWAYLHKLIAEESGAMST